MCFFGVILNLVRNIDLEATGRCIYVYTYPTFSCQTPRFHHGFLRFNAAKGDNGEHEWVQLGDKSHEQGANARGCKLEISALDNRKSRLVRKSSQNMLLIQVNELLLYTVVLLCVVDPERQYLHTLPLQGCLTSPSNGSG